MSERSLGRLAPLAGAAYAVATIAGDLVIGRFPGSGTSPADLAAYYSAHHARVAAGGMVLAWATLLLAVFGCALWARVREAGAHHAWGAAILMASGAAVVAGAQSATAYWVLGHISTEHGVAPAALQAWHVAGAEGGFGVGVAILLLAAGLAGVLPRFLAWPAVVLGLLQLTPLAFPASLAFLLWAAVAGIVLSLRARATDRLVAAAA